MTHLLDCFIVETPAKRWMQKHLDHNDAEFCLIWPFTRAQNGYPTAGKNNAIRPHRIMCERRNGPAPSPEHQAAHSCGNGHLGCVNQWHLNWKTPAENQCERYRQQGGVMPRRRLTPIQVDEIRSMKGRERTVDTAARFQCTEANIRQIQNGQTWRLDRPAPHHFTREEIHRIRNEPQRIGMIPGLAKEFGVSSSTIYRIRIAKSYQHFQPEASLVSRPHQQSPEK